MSMHKKRKTFDVQAFRENVNAYMLNSRDDQRDLRRGMAIALEGVLHDTGNYHGFGYLNKDQMVKSEYGKSVGVNTYRSVSFETLSYKERFAGTDDSRVYYY